jgi:hypothetical protein
MRRCYSFAWAVMIGVLLMATLTPSCVFADSLTITGPASVTIPEDGIQHDFTLTVTNNSGRDLSLTGTSIGVTFLSGDGTDNLAVGGDSFGFPGSCPAGLLANGSSCTVALGVVPASGAGELDADFGTESYQFFVGVTDGVFFEIDSHTTSLTVTDPGFVVATPEPSSIFLLLSGFAATIATMSLFRGWPRL